MTKVQEKHHYYTDQERYDYCRKCKLSGKTISEFVRENGLSRSTLRDWMHAYNNINGKFINVKTVSEKENGIIEDKDVTVNILSEIKKNNKSSHFNRFNHSIVVIEYKELKITTSLSQAEKLIEKLHDKVFQTSGSYAGARYTTKLFSIVQTCKINNINVERYFDHVLKI